MGYIISSWLSLNIPTVVTCHPVTLVLGPGDAVSIFVSNLRLVELHATANLRVASPAIWTSQSDHHLQNQLPVSDSHSFKHLVSFCLVGPRLIAAHLKFEFIKLKRDQSAERVIVPSSLQLSSGVDRE